MSQSVFADQFLSNPNLSDFTALAEKLQETAQALLEFSQANRISDNYAVESENSPTPEKLPPEYRTYLVPGHMVAEEKKLLGLYRADSWQEMLNQAHDQIYTVAMLMRHFGTEEDIDGFSVQLMGESLMAPLRMFNSACSLVADFRLQPESE